MGQIGGAYVAYATGYAEATRNLSRKHLGPSPSMVTSSRPLPLSRHLRFFIGYHTLGIARVSFLIKFLHVKKNVAQLNLKRFWIHPR